MCSCRWGVEFWFDINAASQTIGGGGGLRDKRQGTNVGDERSANALDGRIGARVRSRRLELEMSQEQLAELLGVTFQQVQKYEKGVNRIAASRLFDIAEALELPVSRFFDAASEKRTRSARSISLDEALASPETIELVHLFGSIKSAKIRRRIVTLVKTMIEET